MGEAPPREKALLMDGARMERTLARMAHEILERRAQLEGVVLVVSGAPVMARVVDEEGAARQAREWRAAGSSQKEVARRLAAEFGMTRNEAYRLSLEVE